VPERKENSASDGVQGGKKKKISGRREGKKGASFPLEDEKKRGKGGLFLSILSGGRGGGGSPGNGGRGRREKIPF